MLMCVCAYLHHLMIGCTGNVQVQGDSLEQGFHWSQHVATVNTESADHDLFSLAGLVRGGLSALAQLRQACRENTPRTLESWLTR